MHTRVCISGYPRYAYPGTRGMYRVSVCTLLLICIWLYVAMLHTILCQEYPHTSTGMHMIVDMHMHIITHSTAMDMHMIIHSNVAYNCISGIPRDTRILVLSECIQNIRSKSICIGICIQHATQTVPGYPNLQCMRALTLHRWQQTTVDHASPPVPSLSYPSWAVLAPPLAQTPSQPDGHMRWCPVPHPVPKHQIPARAGSMPGLGDYL